MAHEENHSEWAQAYSAFWVFDTPQSCSGCLQTPSVAFAAHSSQAAHWFGGESSLGRAVEHSAPSTGDAAACLPQRCSSKPITSPTGEILLYPVLCRAFTRSVLLAWSRSPKDPQNVPASKPPLQSWRKKSKQTSKSPNGGRKLPPVLQEVSLYNPKVCGGDDINTHSGISLPAQLRSSWEAHSSALRCLLKSPAFLCTSLTTALCASLSHNPCIVKSELLALLPKAGCKITPSPLS